jgi:hypothetical protein
MKPTKTKPAPTVCISGSSRFCDRIAVLAWDVEKSGEIALATHLLPFWYTPTTDHLAEEQECAEALQELHLRKIELADRLLVANFEGYIGESTRAAIEHAQKLGKPIAYIEPERAP